MNAPTLPTVLVVENEALLLMEFENAVQEAGFLPVSATNGPDALMEIDKDHSRFSAILTDIDLASKVSGWDIARRARELSPGMPIVYMSGGSSQDWQAYGVPESIMLAKPFASAQLVTALAMLITAASSTPKATE